MRKSTHFMKYCLLLSAHGLPHFATGCHVSPHTYITLTHIIIMLMPQPVTPPPPRWIFTYIYIYMYVCIYIYM